MPTETTEVAPETAEAPPPVAPETPPVVEPPPPPPVAPDPLQVERDIAAKKVAAAHRQARLDFDRAQRAKAEREAHQKDIEEAKAFRAFYNEMRGDPAKVAKWLESGQLGVKYEDITDYYLKDGKVDPEKVRDKHLAELRAQQEELRKEHEATKQAIREAEGRRQAAEARAAISERLGQPNAKEQFPIVVAGGEALRKEVFDVQLSILRKGAPDDDIPPGTWVDIDHAAQIVENYYRQQVETYAPAIGWKKAVAAAVAEAKAEDKSSKPPATKAEQQVAASKAPTTLTNTTATSPATADDADSMPKDDAIKHLIQKHLSSKKK